MQDPKIEIVRNEPLPISDHAHIWGWRLADIARTLDNTQSHHDNADIWAAIVDAFIRSLMQNPDKPPS
jgi:hypothetical protein